MSDAREYILARIADTTRHAGSLEERQQQAKDRIDRHARGVLPALNETLADRFLSKASQASATVEFIANLDKLADSVSRYMESQNLATQITVAPSPLLETISWPDKLSIERRIANASDRVAVSVAHAAIAETGTLALLSGPETPTTLNFLPDNFICVLPQQRLVSHMEDVWDLIRDGGPGMPRTLNFITGPSRTADVEQTIQLGAHGPRRLHIIIVEN